MVCAGQPLWRVWKPMLLVWLVLWTGKPVLRVWKPLSWVWKPDMRVRKPFCECESLTESKKAFFWWVWEPDLRVRKPFLWVGKPVQRLLELFWERESLQSQLGTDYKNTGRFQTTVFCAITNYTVERHVLGFIMWLRSLLLSISVFYLELKYGQGTE